MNCREFVDFLMSYLDGELDETVRAVFDAHLGGCRACRAYMDGYVKTIELERSACQDAEGPVPEDVPAELVRAILEARRAGGS